jgi:hypothetical protein
LSIVIADYHCRLSLPIIIADYHCRSSLPIVIADHQCRLSLPIIIADHHCRSSLPIISAFPPNRAAKIAKHRRLTSPGDLAPTTQMHESGESLALVDGQCQPLAVVYSPSRIRPDKFRNSFSIPPSPDFP